MCSARSRILYEVGPIFHKTRHVLKHIQSHLTLPLTLFFWLWTSFCPQVGKNWPTWDSCNLLLLFVHFAITNIFAKFYPNKLNIYCWFQIRFLQKNCSNTIINSNTKSNQEIKDLKKKFEKPLYGKTSTWDSTYALKTPSKFFCPVTVWILFFLEIWHDDILLKNTVKL